VSTASEACFTGNSIYLLTLPGDRTNKKRTYNFIETAIKKGMVRSFTDTLEYWSYPPLDEIQRIAPIIRKRLHQTI